MIVSVVLVVILNLWAWRLEATWDPFAIPPIPDQKLSERGCIAGNIPVS